MYLEMVKWLGCFRLNKLNIFTIWQNIKSYSNRKVAKGHRFIALTVPVHGVVHSWFSIFVT